MTSTLNRQTAQAESLHQLPLTPLEQALKTAYLQRGDIHNSILTAEELGEYYAWMANHHDRSSFSSPSDQIVIMDGDVGQLGRHLLENPRDVTALTQLTSLYSTSPESNTFSADQDITICRPLRYLPPYWHTSEYFEVYYIFSGSCPVHFEKETVILRPGDVIIVPPFTKTATTFTSDDVVLLDIMIRSSTFRQVFLEQLAPSNLMTIFFTKALSGNANSNYLLFRTGLNSDLEQLLLAIYNASTEKNPYSTRMRNPLMSTFFLHLLKQYEHIAEISSHSSLYWKPEFAEMLIYIQTNYRTVTLEEVSRKFGYSQRQIIRIIRSSTDKTFTQLLTQLRMEKAVTLLKQNNMTIEEIAPEVGYSSLSGFYTAFSNYYNTTPGDWKQTQFKR